MEISRPSGSGRTRSVFYNLLEIPCNNKICGYIFTGRLYFYLSLFASWLGLLRPPIYCNQLTVAKRTG